MLTELISDLASGPSSGSFGPRSDPHRSILPCAVWMHKALETSALLGMGFEMSFVDTNVNREEAAAILVSHQVKLPPKPTLLKSVIKR